MLLYLPLLPAETAQQIVPTAQPCETQSPQCSHAMPMHGGAAPFAPQHIVPAGAPTGGHVLVGGGGGGGGFVGGGAGTLASTATMGAAPSPVLASTLGFVLVPGAASVVGLATVGNVT